MGGSFGAEFPSIQRGRISYTQPYGKTRMIPLRTTTALGEQRETFYLSRALKGRTGSGRVHLITDAASLPGAVLPATF